jgi:hypothetical protein
MFLMYMLGVMKTSPRTSDHGARKRMHGSKIL